MLIIKLIEITNITKKKNDNNYTVIMESGKCELNFLLNKFEKKKKNLNKAVFKHYICEYPNFMKNHPKY